MKVPVNEPDITKEDMAELVKLLNSGWISGISPAVERFEENFAEAHDCNYGVATGSGTTALHLAMAALGIGPGDEVIVPDFTMIACPNAVTYLGAKPVFVDAHPKSWCIDWRKIEEEITDKTRAIMPVHIYGHPADMLEICKIADKHNLFIVEDCAEAHGATYSLRKVGSFGNCGCFSFYANKIITTGEGGMIVTNDNELAEKARWLRAHAFGKEGKHFWHEQLGFGYRMSGLQAALGLSQLRRIDTYVEAHRRNAQLYMNLLRGLEISGKIGYPMQRVGTKNVYWMFSITINEEAFGRSRDWLMNQLAGDGIETRTMFYPMHIQPPYLESKDYPVASLLSRTGMNLPSGNTLRPDQIYYVCERLRHYAGESEAIAQREKELAERVKFVTDEELAEMLKKENAEAAEEN